MKIKEMLKKAKDATVEKSKAVWAYTKDVASVIRENKAVAAAVVIGLATVGSEGYKAHAGCMNGIESVRKNAPEADVVKE